MTETPDRAAVVHTYETIGDHFAETRPEPWPEVADFLAAAEDGRVGLGIGSGNGRHLVPLAERVDRVLGLDPARAVLARSIERTETCSVPVDHCQGDAARLPVRDDVVDVAVYVATIHHLPTREGRIRSLDELARVLAADGRAILSAWATTHDAFDVDPEAEEGFDTTVDWTLPDGTVVDRFYHVYAPAEFERDLAASDLAVESTQVASGNCYAVVTPGS